MKVADLYALFSFRVDSRSLNQAHRGLRSIRLGVRNLGMLFAGGALANGLIGFNSRMEDARLNLASMIALARKSSVSAELQTASNLYDQIRKRAADVAGTTEEHVKAAQSLIFPLTKAGFSMEKIRDLSVNTVVAAKGIGITSVAASVRDVQQFLAGRFTSTDLFLNSLFGFPDEEKRKKLKSGTVEDRARRIEEALTQKQIIESAELQSKTFSGQMDKMKEATAQFLGQVGLPLFKALTAAMKDANKWLTANKETVEKVATSVGGVLKAAFSAIGGVLKFLISNSDEAKAVLFGLGVAAGVFAAKMAIAWFTAFGPIILFVGRVALLHLLFVKLRDSIGTVGALLLTAFGAALLFRFKVVTTAIWGMVRAMVAARAASAGAGAASGLGGLMLNPVGSALGGAAGGAARGAAGAAGAGGLAGLAGVLGPLALAAGLTYGVYELGNAIDPTTNQAGAGAAAAAFTGGSSLWEAMDIGAKTAPTTNNVEINAPITINGVKDSAMADELAAAHDKLMRQTMESYSGGKR